MSTKITAQVGDMQIKVEYEEWNQKYKPHSLLVSFNGYQWHGTALETEEQVVGLRDALNEYIWARGIE